MKIFNLQTEGETATYKLEDREFEDFDKVIQDVEKHLTQYGGPNHVLRLAVRPNIPYPAHSKEPLYMYLPKDIQLGSLLEKKLRVENRAHVIRDQETLLEDFMFGIVRQGNERIPYRLDCDTILQFNINDSKIDVTVLCNTVDFIVPSEWDGDFETLLEQVDDLLVSNGFNKGFGRTPEINPLRV